MSSESKSAVPDGDPRDREDDPTDTAHPTGQDQAEENAENEPPG